jgi:hypothetical protein
MSEMKIQDNKLPNGTYACICSIWDNPCGGKWIEWSDKGEARRLTINRALEMVENDYFEEITTAPSEREKVGWNEFRQDLETEQMIVGKNQYSVLHICPEHGTGCNVPLGNDCIDCKLYLSGEDVRTLIKQEKLALIEELRKLSACSNCVHCMIKENLDNELDELEKEI